MNNNNNKNILFFNIIKNSGPDFKFREELIKLHSRNLQLESSINLRKEAEYEYNKLKIKELTNKGFDKVKVEKAIEKKEEIFAVFMKEKLFS